MDNSDDLCFKEESRISGFFCGEKIAWSLDGDLLYCQKSGNLNVVSAHTGNIVRNINLQNCYSYEEEYDELLTFDLSLDKQYIITAHKSGLIMLWNEHNGMKVKQWKSNHFGSISKLLFSPCNKRVCSTSADAVSVWDFTNQLCSISIEMHGLVSVIKFFPNASSPFLFVAGDDNVINCWNHIRKVHVKSYKGHLSQVSDIDFNENLQFMSSVSLDQVLILWKLSDGSKFKVIPLYESLKGVFFVIPRILNVTNDGMQKLLVVAAGLSGNIYLVNCEESTVISVQQSIHESKCVGRNKNSIITHLLYCKRAKEFAVIRSDYNILFFDITTFRFSRQLIGYIDEIFDMCFLGKTDQFVAIASNNADIKIYNLLNFNSAVASGHQETVLTISGYKNYLFSAGKDFIIFIWLLDPASFTIRNIQKCSGHTSAIQSISLSNLNFDMLGSVSQDGCLKLWTSTVRKNMEPEEYTFQLSNSVVAHNKQIDCITFSDNNNILATGSKDKYIKIWNCKNLSLVGTLRGHQRGICTIRFSPVDQILVSTSNDCTIRIWSVMKLMCLIKIEHEFSLLRLEFVSKGKYFITTDSTGTIKIWNVKRSECVSTLDGHNDQLWSLVVASDDSIFLTGGVGAEIICWRNVTELKCMENQKKKHIQNIQSQALQNLFKEKQYEPALFLALTLNKPLISRNILSKLIRNKASLDIVTEKKFSDVRKNFLKHIKAWNTKSRHCKISQLIIFSLLNKVINTPLDTFNLLELVEDTRPYTKRHYKRLSLNIQDLNFLEFTVKCM